MLCPNRLRRDDIVVRASRTITIGLNFRSSFFHKSKANIEREFFTLYYLLIQIARILCFPINGKISVFSFRNYKQFWNYTRSVNRYYILYKQR